MFTLPETFSDNWPMWFVTAVLIVAAGIDAKTLKVPNWLTFPFVISGWVAASYGGGITGLGASLTATFTSMMLLLPLRNMGGMGAGDVKLLGGIGAWCGLTVTLKAFAATAIVGGLMALCMIAARGDWLRHYRQAVTIMSEWISIRRPDKLAAIAGERKPTMCLLPYAVPMAVGTILYFSYADMLL